MQTDLQPVFRALGDPTRRAIIEMLAQEPRTINAIVRNFDVSRPAVAKHLKILHEGGLIEVRQQGRERINTLRPETLKTASDWMAHFDHFWDDKLAKLKKAIEETT